MRAPPPELINLRMACLAESFPFDETDPQSLTMRGHSTYCIDSLLAADEALDSLVSWESDRVSICAVTSDVVGVLNVDEQAERIYGRV